MIIIIATEETTKTVLLTGFENEKEIGKNPSWQLVSMMDGKIIDGWKIESRKVPDVFLKATEALMKAVKETNPDAVVCFGHTPDEEIKVETTASNFYRLELTDNIGKHPPSLRIDPKGKASLKATLPVDKVLKAIKDAGFNVHKSDDAGGHTCNEILYNLLASKDCPEIVGFVHIPKKFKDSSLERIAKAVIGAL